MLHHVASHQDLQCLLMSLLRFLGKKGLTLYAITKISFSVIRKNKIMIYLL